MPAEKCGTPMPTELVKCNNKKVIEKSRPTIIMSQKATKIFEVIKKRYPNFQPANETDVWIKAHKMGLLDDDE